jgi:hypothetical protein
MPRILFRQAAISHFVDADELKAKGGAVRFVTDWLATEAKSRAFVTAEQKRLQGDLFRWADRRTPSRPKPTGRRPPPRAPR